MAFVDPERFKRFEQFLTKHQRLFADAANRGFSMKGPGVLIYYAPDGRFDPPAGPLRFEYKTRADIEKLHEGARDEMLQGMLERYQPPGEALFVAVYPDNTYDITRVVMSTDPAPPPAAPRPN